MRLKATSNTCWLINIQTAKNVKEEPVNQMVVPSLSWKSQGCLLS